MVNAKLKSSFFDRKAVVAAIGKARADALSKIGAFLQRRARSSLRKRKPQAKPGNPPSVHTDDSVRTLKNIWFAYDNASRSLVVGPLLLGGQKGTPRGVPNLLEFGGTVQANGRTIYVTRQAGRNSAGQFVSRGKERIQLTGAMNYHRFPFMGPALDKEIAAGTLPAQWANSVKAS